MLLRPPALPSAPAARSAPSEGGAELLQLVQLVQLAALEAAISSAGGALLLSAVGWAAPCGPSAPSAAPPQPPKCPAQHSAAVMGPSVPSIAHLRADTEPQKGPFWPQTHPSAAAGFGFAGAAGLRGGCVGSVPCSPAGAALWERRAGRAPSSSHPGPRSSFFSHECGRAARCSRPSGCAVHKQAVLPTRGFPQRWEVPLCSRSGRPDPRGGRIGAFFLQQQSCAVPFLAPCCVVHSRPFNPPRSPGAELPAGRFGAGQSTVAAARVGAEGPLWGCRAAFGPFRIPAWSSAAAPPPALP